ncbi:MAG: ABC transporter substrate-binding protein [Chloroflexi bacterium]|nr:ABC transporter substrate-binding protein [Chloroflexota bacterium]
MALRRPFFLALLAAISIWLLACAAPATPTPTLTKAPPPAAPAATAPPAATKAPAAATAPAATTVPKAASPAAKAPADKPLDPPIVFKMGTQGIPTSAPLYIADARGYYAEQGIKLDWVRFDSGPRQVPALSTNQILAGTGAIGAGVFNAIGRGLGMRIVAPQSQYEKGFSPVYIIVRKDLADSGVIKDYKDLKGKTVAIPSTASSIEYMLDKALEMGGLKLDDVNVTQLSQPDMVAALANKSIDVALPAEPQLAIAVDKGVGVRWREGAEIVPGIQTTVIMFSPQLMQNTEVANRWMIAYIKALRDYVDFLRTNKDREQIISTLINYTDLKDRALYDRMVYSSLDPNGKFNLDSLKEQLAWHRSRGTIEGQIDLNEAIDTRFVDYAVSRLGPYKE